MTRRVRVGISTCPNDTFAFHALLAGEVRIPGVELAIELADVEILNERMLAGELDLAKASFHAMLAMSERVRVLPCGAALGSGVGPLLLAARGQGVKAGAIPASERVLCPGRWTTATLLLRLFHPEATRIEQRVFSAILPELSRGSAGYGVCIHEARFTWREHGVELVEDLGETWERETGGVLPLGGLAVSRALEPELALRLARGVQSSLEWALTHREACLATMRRYAQEQSDAVLWSHVELYVNERTLELGPAGRAALRELSRLAQAHGCLPAGGGELEVLEN